MSHFVLFSYILLLCSSGGGVLALLLLHQRLRKALTAALLTVNVLLLLSLLLQVSWFYFHGDLAGRPLLAGALQLLGALLGLGVYAGTAGVLLALPDSPRPWIRGAFLAAAAVVVTQLVLSLTQGSPSSFLRYLFMGLISLYLFFVGFVMVRRGRLLREATLQWMMGVLGWLTLVFSVVSTAGYLLIARIPFLSSLDISLDFIYYFLWNLLSMTALIRYLLQPSALVEEGGISDAFLRQYGITPREREVIEMISRGMTNQQIAKELYVSFTTVRTHVYNIFRKTEVNRRVELLQLVSGFRE